jgi:hypothetical protein
VKVEILHIAHCAGRHTAAAHTREALDALGLADAPMEFVPIDGNGPAHPGFAGSPTILVDGTDLFPSDGRTTALACRVYVTETGPTDAPSRSQIERALRARTP